MLKISLVAVALAHVLFAIHLDRASDFVTPQPLAQQTSSNVGVQPYGVNNWQWPDSTCQLFSEAYLNRYRLLVAWRDFEPEDNRYVFNDPPTRSLKDALSCAARWEAKVSLVVYRAPLWALQSERLQMSYDADEYAEFVGQLLDYAVSAYPGVVEAVEIDNETPTNTWVEGAPPTFGTYYRDPSQSYIEVLRKASDVVRQFNADNGTEILVVMDGIWEGAYHHLDELYQLGCGGCFDRINFHYYLVEQRSTDQGKPADPEDLSTVWHFATSLNYLRHIANDWGDAEKLIWLTEFGWRYGGNSGFVDFKDFTPDPDQEQLKAQYTRAVLDAARRSGMVERAHLYVGTATPLDTMSLLYVEKDWAPGGVSDHVLTPLYDMYLDYANAFPLWGPPGLQQLIVPASSDIAIQNPGLENSTDGWQGLALDSDIAHTGRSSGTRPFLGEELAQTAVSYRVEPAKLYEIKFWVRLEAEDVGDAIVFPIVLQEGCSADESRWRPPNYLGIVDTQNYPNGWRQIRFPYVAPSCAQRVALSLIANGRGTLWVDDVSMAALDLLNVD